MITNEPWWRFMPGMGVSYQGQNCIFVGHADPETANLVPLDRAEFVQAPLGEVVPVVIHPGTAGWIPVLRARGAMVNMGGSMMDSLVNMVRPFYED